MFLPKAWHLPFLTLLLAVGLVGGLRYWRSRATTPEMLQRHFPDRVNTLAYLDVEALQRVGLLDRLAGKAGGQESDYLRFVEESAFDYQRDLRSLLIGFDGETTHVLATGSFDWTALRNYAESRNGVCRFSLCRMPAYGKTRAISWGPLRSDVIAFSIGPDQWSAGILLNEPKSNRSPVLVTAPLWLSSTGKALRDAQNLPAGVRSFSRALEPADRVVLAVNAGKLNGEFELQLTADFPKPELAAQVADQLRQVTATLRNLLVQEKKKPNPADLSGVLAAGTFQSQANRVSGVWPLPRQFVETLTVAGP